MLFKPLRASNVFGRLFVLAWRPDLPGAKVERLVVCEFSNVFGRLFYIEWRQGELGANISWKHHWYQGLTKLNKFNSL